ncbi:Toll-like receptor 2 [Mizuhopecten yessoensis]|uniref:Toll-like receptor 2 n=1 Tax=Mizuhopecten yessoensis TaxID=6573 RepID=A0A210Q450_MIZYE|nr:Toll-like receptor 2 [Mizuhopecten yessoensis]
MERDCASYVVTAIVLSVSVVVGGLGYRYRWTLRYVYYMTKNKFVLNDHVRNCQDILVYTYDAFLSHAEEDSDFVTGDLLRNMEEINQLNICLHKRDFIPGRDIAGNVTNAIHNSRRTVVILSPDFLRS